MAINISLPKELENLVHEKVKSGLYSSASEVVRDALRRTFLKPTEEEIMGAFLEERLQRIKRGEEEFIEDEDAAKKIRKSVLKEHLETA